MSAATGTWDNFCDRIDVLVSGGHYNTRGEAGQALRQTPEFRGVVAPGGRVVAASGAVAGRASAPASRPGGNAEAQIAARAEEIRRGNPALTKEQAYVQALNEHPELYEQYLREHPAQVGARVSY